MSYNFEQIKRTKVIDSSIINERAEGLSSVNKKAPLNSENLLHMAEYINHVCSHELKEPVKNLSNLIQLLHSQNAEKLDEESLSYIHHIFNNLNRMQTLIKDIAHHFEITKCAPPRIQLFA